MDSSIDARFVMLDISINALRPRDEPIVTTLEWVYYSTIGAIAIIATEVGQFVEHYILPMNAHNSATAIPRDDGSWTERIALTLASQPDSVECGATRIH